MDALDLWRGEFGDEYTQRNQVDWQQRIPFWERIMRFTGARSVFEVGCNAGWNLSAIKSVAPYARAAGSDINPRALEQASAAGLEVYECLDFTRVEGKFDLVFTAGVLIHVEPENVREIMRAIVDKSFRHVFAIEYGASFEEAIPYRGHDDKCWKRPYDVLYKDLGVKQVWYEVEARGFDRCKAWGFEK